MNRIDLIRKRHDEELQGHCLKNSVKFTSIQILLEAEKVKQFIKRNAQIQHTIDKQIDNSLDDENR